MGSYLIEMTSDALVDLKILNKSGNKKDIYKLEQFIIELTQNPRIGLGKPERLKHIPNREIWSRRINQKDRLVYEIIESHFFSPFSKQILELIFLVYLLTISSRLH